MNLIQRILAYKPTAMYLAARGMELAAHAFTLKACGMAPKAHCFWQNEHRFVFKACSVAAPQRTFEFKAHDFMTKW